MRAPSMIAATTVVPMPVYSVRSSEARNTRRLATLIAVISRFAANDSAGLKPNGQVKSSLDALFVRNARMVSSASCEATSPALCPPMPSATAIAEMSGSHRNASSLIVRTLPGCVRVQTVSIENDLVMNRRGACYDTAASLVAAYPLMFVLVVRHRGGTQRYPLCEGRTVVGRAPQCDVVINDDSISRQHARLVVRPDEVQLSDLQSRNGTYLAGEPILDVTLRGGEQVSFGDVEALLEQRADETVRAPESGTVTGEHTMIRRLGEPAPPAVAARLVDAPRLISLLGEGARPLVAPLPIEEILNPGVALLLGHVPAARAVLVMADSSTRALTSQIVRRQDGQPAQPVEISRTVREMTIKQRVAVLTSDVHQDPRFDGSQSVLLSDVRSLICGPLYAGEELIGLLYVDNPVTRQFSEADLELFSALANY